MEYPIAPATGAIYLNASPRSDTFVLVADDATARTSANSAVSFAFIPNAVSALETISVVVARSRPSAAARLIIPPIPSTIS